ncbi:MAG: mandelate racemase/muconate lactonizing enzyme family protein, partial [Deltaproteobacteria bacterium]|nr:mandelate racemase/muconate lactonizing enzyme family protein [Deltaproteobacteria bacterium]
MKITRIETIGLKASLKETWIASGFTIKETTSTIVRISTDACITGYGECLARFTTKITQTIVESLLKPILLGRDPFDVEILWEEMFATMRTKGHSKGFMIEAMSGVDMALWDVMGKAAGLPICKLLGGKARDRVEAYASALLFKDLDTLRAEAAELAGKGYRAIKMKVGKGLEEDLRSIEAVRSEIGPGVKLMLDANSGFDSFSALSL